MAASTSLRGEVALVTGAGRGIGRAVALQLASLGARVGLLARTETELRAVANEIKAAGGEAYTLTCDVLVPEEIAAAVESLVKQAGGLTILVNNAGSGKSAPFAKTSRKLWDDMLALNATAPFAVAQAALPHMLQAGHGRIVNVASVAGLKGYPYIAAYCASKHAIVGLTRALAVELAGKKITVNAVCPGYVDSAMTDKNIEVMAEKTGRAQDVIRREIEGMNPQHRLFTPEEVAATVAYLCTADARGITGQALPVCGGEMPV